MFPDKSAQLTHILVVKDSKRSKDWYEKILGAKIYGEYGSSVVLDFLGNWLLLVEEGGPTEDKPDVSMKYPTNMKVVDHSFTIRVENCQSTYKALSERGAKFLTKPVKYSSEIRAFFRDPDGHLYEISQRI